MEFDLERAVWWEGDVCSDDAQKMLARFYELLKKDKKEPITLHINSDGGEPTIAFSFYEFIRLYKVQLRTIAMGEVHSAAVTLFLAGQQRFVTPSTTMVLHRVRTSFTRDKSYTADDFERHACGARHLERRYNEIIVSQTKLTPRKIRTMCNRGARLNPEQIVEHGFAQAII